MFWELLLAQEALASCKIEGIAKETTLLDYFLARAIEADREARIKLGIPLDKEM